MTTSRAMPQTKGRFMDESRRMRVIPLVAAAVAISAITLMAVQSPPANESTIRGRVLDPDGRPMAGVEVRALLIRSEKHVSGAMAMSDAEGKFEIQGVPPERVILRAQPRATHAIFHPPAYFPGVLTLPDAWPIEVKPREIIELDFHMPPVF